MTASLSRNDVLDALGFSRRRHTSDYNQMLMPALGIFGAGMLVGAGIALMMAPKSGRELRDDVYRGANKLGSNIRGRLPMRQHQEHEDIHASAMTDTTR